MNGITLWSYCIRTGRRRRKVRKVRNVYVMSEINDYYYYYYIHDYEDVNIHIILNSMSENS